MTNPSKTIKAEDIGQHQRFEDVNVNESSSVKIEIRQEDQFPEHFETNDNFSVTDDDQKRIFTQDVFSKTKTKLQKHDREPRLGR